MDRDRLYQELDHFNNVEDTDKILVLCDALEENGYREVQSLRDATMVLAKWGKDVLAPGRKQNLPNNWNYNTYWNHRNRFVYELDKATKWANMDRQGLKSLEAFATDKPRVISHMPIPPLLQSDNTFLALMAEGKEQEAADRAEQLGFYALAHAMRRDATHEEGKADVGLMVNAKGLGSPNICLQLIGHLQRVEKDKNKLLIIADAAEEAGYRDAAAFRKSIRKWSTKTVHRYPDGYTYECYEDEGDCESQKQSMVQWGPSEHERWTTSIMPHLRRIKEWAQNVCRGKSMGSFLSKNFNLPKVRRGILHSR